MQTRTITVIEMMHVLRSSLLPPSLTTTATMKKNRSFIVDEKTSKEKIQFVTKIERDERKKNIDQLKLLCVERTIAYKFDCLSHISIFCMFYSTLILL